MSKNKSVKIAEPTSNKLEFVIISADICEAQHCICEFCQSHLILAFMTMTASRQLYEPHATMIEYKKARFLITDQPTAYNMDKFIEECQNYHVKDLVRVCEPDYDKSKLEEAGIKVLDWIFDDGSPPPDEVICMWHDLVKDRFKTNSIYSANRKLSAASVPSPCDTNIDTEEHCVAIHCKAGLGRAPALVAVALIEMGLPYDEAIDMIRTKRRGALNAKQIQFLKNYKPKRRLRLNSKNDRCSVM